MNNNCCLVIIASQSLYQHPIKLECEKKQKETKLYIYTHTTHSLAELSRPSDILIVERESEVKLYFTFFKSVNHNGKQHTYTAIATMISKWRWKPADAILSLSRIESLNKKKRREREREREEYFNLSWHTDALFLTFLKREKKESESE